MLSRSQKTVGVISESALPCTEMAGLAVFFTVLRAVRCRVITLLLLQVDVSTSESTCALLPDTHKDVFSSCCLFRGLFVDDV